MPDDLILFLALTLCVRNRDVEAARHGLRLVAMKLEPREGIRFTQTLVNTLDPGGRYWLRNLLGERPEPQLLQEAA